MELLFISAYNFWKYILNFKHANYKPYNINSGYNGR
jgi:hypothetical protein